jgi:hypothetical protein
MARLIKETPVLTGKDAVAFDDKSLIQKSFVLVSKRGKESERISPS